MKSIEISGTKDGGFLVERKFAGITSERFIINPKRECPRFSGDFNKQPLWKREAVAVVQTERRNDPIFFHVEGYIEDDLATSLPVNVKEDPMGWYYWDETWSHYYGPFESYEVAQKNLVAYFAWLNTPKEELPPVLTLPPVDIAPELDHPLHSTLEITGYTEKELTK